MQKPDNFIIVIFGASGDLTKRKLVPALFELYHQQLLPEGFVILGTGRTDLSNNDFHTRVKDFLPEQTSNSHTEKFLKHLHYLPLDPYKTKAYEALKTKLVELDKIFNTEGNYLFYLSTPPKLYDIIPFRLADAGLNEEKNNHAFKRLIIEKPFGYDLTSAKTLNKNLLRFFKEHQIYRIDHYLGKETVQNLLVTRFSNGIFEPLWNRNYVEYIEITSAENLGVESRGGYYDQSGAMRDMVQNHLLQLVGLATMEPPAVVGADAIRNEILKVYQSFRPVKDEDIKKSVIRGQYTSSHIKNKFLKGYREEEGVDNNSKTETYLAMNFYIDNWRWAGVPVYVRTGKRLPTRVTEIVIHFKPTPHHIFHSLKYINTDHNMLIIRIQPDEGILLKFGMKLPGSGFNVQTVNMDFHYSDLSDDRLPTAYERLLLDSMLGDSTLYARGDIVESAWEFVQPILDAFENDKELKIYGYPAGTWGPDIADNYFDGPMHSWRYPCKNLVDDGTYCEL
jgi:glucose-6-phosphate 1-dehydrogenase